MRRFPPPLNCSQTPWQARYDKNEEVYEVHNEQQRLMRVDSKGDQANRDAHLIAAAPLLYEALKELLASTEEALFEHNQGCECDRCEAAKSRAYRALGWAEGKTSLKEG